MKSHENGNKPIILMDENGTLFEGRFLVISS